MNNWPNPFIEQRADPFILRHLSHYYFIASVPEYDRLEIRRAVTLEGLRDAEPVVVWRDIPLTVYFMQLRRPNQLAHRPALRRAPNHDRLSIARRKAGR